MKNKKKGSKKGNTDWRDIIVELTGTGGLHECAICNNRPPASYRSVWQHCREEHQDVAELLSRAPIPDEMTMTARQRSASAQHLRAAAQEQLFSDIVPHATSPGPSPARKRRIAEPPPPKKWRSLKELSQMQEPFTATRQIVGALPGHIDIDEQQQLDLPWPSHGEAYLQGEQAHAWPAHHSEQQQLEQQQRQADQHDLAIGVIDAEAEVEADDLEGLHDEGDSELLVMQSDLDDDEELPPLPLSPAPQQDPHLPVFLASPVRQAMAPATENTHDHGAEAVGGTTRGCECGSIDCQRPYTRPNTGAFFAAHKEVAICASSSMTVHQLSQRLLALCQDMSEDSFRRVLSLISDALPSPAMVPPSLDVLMSTIGVHNWKLYQRHICPNSACSSHVWPYVSCSEWEQHRHDLCPLCGEGQRFRVVAVSGKTVLEPSAWYLDLQVERVIRDDFFGSPEWRQAYSEAQRDTSSGSQLGSPYMQETEQAAATFIGLPPNTPIFRHRCTGVWEVMTDGFKVYDSRAYSVYMIGLR